MPTISNTLIYNIFVKFHRRSRPFDTFLDLLSIFQDTTRLWYIDDVYLSSMWEADFRNWPSKKFFPESKDDYFRKISHLLTCNHPTGSVSGQTKRKPQSANKLRICLGFSIWQQLKVTNEAVSKLFKTRQLNNKNWQIL